MFYVRRFWCWNFFYQPIVANLPQHATWIVRFLKTFKFWVFLKNSGFFSKENLKVFQFAKEGKFNLHCASDDIFSEKILYYLDCEVFRPTIQKISNLGKLETMMNHGSVLKKKGFHRSKRHLYKNGKMGRWKICQWWLAVLLIIHRFLSANKYSIVAALLGSFY